MSRKENMDSPSYLDRDNGQDTGWLLRQIQDAGHSVQKLKRYSPYMFPEWQELQLAEVMLRKAKERYASAKKRWRDLGANTTPPTTPEEK